MGKEDVMECVEAQRIMDSDSASEAEIAAALVHVRQQCQRCREEDDAAKELADLAVDTYWEDVARHGSKELGFPTAAERYRRIAAACDELRKKK